MPGSNACIVNGADSKDNDVATGTCRTVNGDDEEDNRHTHDDSVVVQDKLQGSEIQEVDVAVAQTSSGNNGFAHDTDRAVNGDSREESKHAHNDSIVVQDKLGYSEIQEVETAQSRAAVCQQTIEVTAEHSEYELSTIEQCGDTGMLNMQELVHKKIDVEVEIEVGEDGVREAGETQYNDKSTELDVQENKSSQQVVSRWPSPGMV